VIVNTRGGGEFGDEWRKAAIQEKKQNTFNDFIAAAETVTKMGITDSTKLFIEGGSSGGMLVTAVTNQRPELFAATISNVPVTDMLRYQLFTGGRMWADNYGCSDNKGAVDYLMQYSPLHTIKHVKYPSMMVLAADHDDRVVPLHTYKFVATLQYTAGTIEGQNPLLMRIEENAGHGAGLPMAKAMQKEADIYAFVAKVTNTSLV